MHKKLTEKCNQLSNGQSISLSFEELQYIAKDWFTTHSRTKFNVDNIKFTTEEKDKIKWQIHSEM